MDNTQLNSQLIHRLAEIVNQLDETGDLPGLWQQLVSEFITKANLLDVNGGQNWDVTLGLAKLAACKKNPVKTSRRKILPTRDSPD